MEVGIYGIIFRGVVIRMKAGKKSSIVLLLSELS